MSLYRPRGIGGVGDGAEGPKPASVNSSSRLSSLQLCEWGASCDKAEYDCPNPGICLGVIDYGMVYIGVSSLIALYPYGGLTPGPDRQN